MRYDSLRGQCVLLLLAGFDELGGRGTKREVLGLISEREYFDAEAEDRLPFPTALQPEPRWELLMGLAWTRCVEGGCIEQSEGDIWQGTAYGSELFREALSQFRDGTFDVNSCFLWTTKFKRHLDPGYVRRPDERHRPAGLYHDLLWHLNMIGSG